jgi:hypothetical protein
MPKLKDKTTETDDQKTGFNLKRRIKEICEKNMIQFNDDLYQKVCEDLEKHITYESIEKIRQQLLKEKRASVVEAAETPAPPAKRFPPKPTPTSSDSPSLGLDTPNH